MYVKKVNYISNKGSKKRQKCKKRQMWCKIFVKVNDVAIFVGNVRVMDAGIKCVRLF